MRLISSLLALIALGAPAVCGENAPKYRPALIGKAPDAIVNRIDTKALAAAGQKNAAIMFCAAVEKTGEVKWSGTYRGTPDSALLEQEVRRALLDAKMIPALRNGQPVPVFYYGTVIFEMIDGRPRLRLFANQDTEELKKENDFVGPQPCVGGDSRFDGLHYPEEATPLPVSGVVELSLKVDAEGSLQDLKVVNESPPLIGFGDAALRDFAQAKFIPAFRNGQPVACEITLPVFYQPKS